MNYNKIKFSFIDFETEGANHKAKEFALVYSIGNKIIKHQEIILKEEESLKEYWQELKKVLSHSIIVAHNLGFDKNILIREFPFLIPKGYLDTLSLYRKFFNQKIQSYSLSELLELFSLKGLLEQLRINEHFVPHRALFDSYACAALFFHITEHYPDINYLVSELLENNNLF